MGETSEARGVDRREPAREQRADHPGKHVAGTGGRQLRHGRLDDAQRLPGEGDQRVRPLQQDAGARQRRRRLDAREAVGVDLPALDAEQPGELSGVWRENRRVRPAGQLAKPSREGEERVGVEQQRRRDLGDEPLDERSDVRIATEPGSADHRAGARCELERALEAAHHQLWRVRRHPVDHRIGNTRPDEPGTGP